VSRKAEEKSTRRQNLEIPEKEETSDLTQANRLYAEAARGFIVYSDPINSQRRPAVASGFRGIYLWK